MTLIDQDEINALLAQADDLSNEAPAFTEEPGPANPPPQSASEEPAQVSPRQSAFVVNDPNLRRLLRLRVPVIAVLARRNMDVAGIRELSNGAIIEFEKSVEDDLTLTINNRTIGFGTAVKVGENFGLRITRIVHAADRLRSVAK